MLTSFFGKSSPLKFLLIGLYVFLIGIAAFYKGYSNETSGLETGYFLGTIFILLATSFLLDFIIRKNLLTLNNSFAVLIFACMAMMLPALLERPKLVIANLFMVLALRRIFSLRSSKNNEIKVLDASLWIGLASIFYFWSLLLLLVLFGALYLKPQTKMRYFLIPIIGLLALFLMVTAGNFLVNDSFQWFVAWLGDTSLDFFEYAPRRILVFITFIGAMLIWAGISKVATIKTKARKERPYQYFLIYVLIISIIVSLFSAEKTGAEFIFFLVPAAIVISSYLEKKSEIWFREALLWIFVSLPIAMLFL